jgi:ATP-dependent helicase/nuclease subunit A
MQNKLELVPAGAGSGKTYRIETTLAAAIAAGDIRANRVLAVTFTEAAASDLRARIRGALLQAGRVDDALGVDRAYVGTIHALGLRLLTEHSFAAGRVPSGRLLSDSERDLLVRLQVDRAPSLQPLVNDLRRYGYEWDRNTGKSAEEKLREKVLEVIDLLRSLGKRGLTKDMADPAIAALREIHGPTRDAALLQATLETAVAVLCRAFPTPLTGITEAKSAKAAFEKDFEALARASVPGGLDRDWGLWKALASLRCSVRGCPTPEGYDGLAQAVIEAAQVLRYHPGPLKESEDHLLALVHGAQEIMAAYEAEKRSRGLLDYADMIVETEELLRTRPEILEAVLGEIDCVVIDEFQDTNPVQFAMLWRLASRARHAILVGDRKQAIMGFQGADPRLSAALDAAYPDKVDPLTENHRSVPGIMELVNAVGPALFPEGYDPLAPRRKPTGQVALEFLDIGGKKDAFYGGIAAYVRELVDEAPPVEDKATKQLRPLRSSDVAVLTFSRIDAARAAAALRAVGVPVRLPEKGWFESRAVQVARAALAYAADPSDQFSALVLLSLGPDRAGLDHALSRVIEKSLSSEARLDRLAAYSVIANDLSLQEVLPRVLDLAGIPAWIATLPNRAAAEANIGRLLNEATLFAAAAPSLRAAAGFHGHSIKTFLGWLADQAERGLDHCPDAEGWVVEGVEISTWHASKGREWPVTVVAGFDKDICARPNTIRAEFKSFYDLDTVLDGAGLSWFPAFACTETQEEFASRRIEDDEREAARALYVALTRARDRLVLAMAPPPKGKKDPSARPKTMAALLRGRVGLVPGANHVEVRGEKIAAKWGVVLPADEQDGVNVPVSGAWAIPGLPTELSSAPRTAWRSSPSSMVATPAAVAPVLEHVDLGASCKGVDAFSAATERGTAYHLAFRVLAERPDLAHKLSAATGLSEAALYRVALNVEALRAWLVSRGFTKLHLEIPLQLEEKDGSQVNAIVDLLAESETGLIIVDHKTGPCPDPTVRYAGYEPQLQAYAGVLARAWPYKPVQFLAVHWMDEGSVSVATIPALRGEAQVVAV